MESIKKFWGKNRCVIIPSGVFVIALYMFCFFITCQTNWFTMGSTILSVVLIAVGVVWNIEAHSKRFCGRY